MAPSAEALLGRVRTLMAHYQAGRIATLSRHEVNPGLPPESRENYLYFTLPVCINFQRSSPAMWTAALATWQDPTTNYVFFPEKLSTASIEQIRADLIRHKLALQPVKHTLIWTTIAATLHQHYKGDPRRIMTAAGYDAGRLIQLLQIDQRRRFPYLCGPKLSNYWPYILLHYTDLKLTTPEAISIIPDTHVIQASAKLGLVAPGASAQTVELAWQSLLTGSGINPADVHPVLWNWSRAGFVPEV